MTTTNIWLTDEQADIEGYLHAKIGKKSDNPSLVRAVTNTVAGPTSGVQVTRTAGAATPLAWITDPLLATDLTANTWIEHIWALESNLAANAAIRLQVLRYTNAESTTVLDHASTTEFITTTQDVNITTVAATTTSLAEGDRLVFKLFIDDALSSMAAGYTATVSYNGFFPRAEGDTYLICPDSLLVSEQIPSDTLLSLRMLLKDRSSTNPLVADDELIAAFNNALNEYSRVKSLLVMQYYSGDGTTYQFSLPRLWVQGLSSVISIEYPADLQPKAFLTKDDDWGIANGWLGVQPTQRIWFSLTPQSGTNNFLVAYTTNHLHTQDITTVPINDFQAVCWLAASYAARTMSARSAGATDSSLNADVVNYRDATSKWKDVAIQFYDLYKNHISQSEPVDITASGRSDWDTAMSDKRDFIWHRRRFR